MAFVSVGRVCGRVRALAQLSLTRRMSSGGSVQPQQATINGRHVDLKEGAPGRTMTVMDACRELGRSPRSEPNPLCLELASSFLPMHSAGGGRPHFERVCRSSIKNLLSYAPPTPQGSRYPNCATTRRSCPSAFAVCVSSTSGRKNWYVITLSASNCTRHVNHGPFYITPRPFPRRVCLATLQQPACTTPLEPGMAVTTHSKEIESEVRVALQLLRSRHHMACATCQSSGNCELQVKAPWRQPPATDIRRNPLSLCCRISPYPPTNLSRTFSPSTM